MARDLGLFSLVQDWPIQSSLTSDTSALFIVYSLINRKLQRSFSFYGTYIHFTFIHFCIIKILCSTLYHICRNKSPGKPYRTKFEKRWLYETEFCLAREPGDPYTEWTGSGLCHGSTVVRSLVGKPEPNKLYRAEILSLRTNISGNIFDSVVSFFWTCFLDDVVSNGMNERHMPHVFVKHNYVGLQDRKCSKNSLNFATS